MSKSNRATPKIVVTRRDFISRASLFLSMAGLSPLLKPYVMDLLIARARADEGPDSLPLRTFFMSDKGGLPWCTYACPHLALSSPPTDLSFYNAPGDSPSVTVTPGGTQGNLVQPGPYGAWPTWLKQQTMIYMGDAGTSGHNMPGRSSHLTDNGAQPSPWLLNAQRQSGFLVNGVEFRSGGEEVNINVGLPAALNPQPVTVADSLSQTEGNLSNLFGAVSFVTLDREVEVPLLKAVLHALSVRFGNDRVATTDVRSAVEAQQTGHALLTRNLADLVKLDAATLSAYAVNENVGGVQLGRILALTEKLFANGLTGNVAYAVDTGDWHYRPSMTDNNDRVYRMQRAMASQIKVFMERMEKVEDPQRPGKSLGDAIHLQLSSYQGRGNRNDGGWGDNGNHASLVVNPNVMAGTYGGVQASGGNMRVNTDGSASAGDGNPRRFLNTIYRAMKIEKEIAGAGVVEAALKLGV